MRIKEITEYVTKYVHPDVDKQLKKYEKRATKRTRMGYSPGFLAYPYRVKETKEAPPGTYFTKTGNLVKGRLTKAAREKGARETDPKDSQRSKVPPVTQRVFTKGPLCRQEEEMKFYVSGIILTILLLAFFTMLWMKGTPVNF